MVTVEYAPSFREVVARITDSALKERVKKQIAKLVANPEVGKPMRYARKGTRELYIPPFRLSYTYLVTEGKIILLDLYHKDRR